VGKNHYVTGVVQVPKGIYNLYVTGVFAITSGYDPETLIGPVLHVTANINGDNPMFVDAPNRNWQEIRSFTKKSSYRCMGSTEVDLSVFSLNTVEVRCGLRDDDSPVVPGDGYDDTTVFIFQVNSLLTLKSVVG
jgi:hypothetical protein